MRDELKAEAVTVAATATGSKTRTTRRIESSFGRFVQVALVVRDRSGARRETAGHFRDCSELATPPPEGPSAENSGIGDGMGSLGDVNHSGLRRRQRDAAAAIGEKLTNAGFGV
jgi:hypothetical protein